MFLNFGNYSDNSFILSNYYIIKSGKVDFQFNFDANVDLTKKSNSGNIQNNEVFSFVFSPYMFDTSDFDKNLTETELHGYIVYFYRKNNKEYVSLEKLAEPKTVNL